MILVDVQRNKHGGIEVFTMSGHADSGPYGYDLVCAAASAVSFGAVNAVAELCNVYMDTEMKDGGGFLRCQLPGIQEEATYEKVQWLLEGMLVSMRSIEEQYSQFIRIES